MLFTNRQEAGQKLAAALLKYKTDNPIILALPRGGVPVAYEVARKLKAPLDVLTVRKLGAPGHAEFGIGAIAPDKIRILDETLIKNLEITPQEINYITEMEEQELIRRQKLYRENKPKPNYFGKSVIIVDDGLATGITLKAAVKAVVRDDPKKIIAAVPVCDQKSFQDLRKFVRPRVDEVICLTSLLNIQSVGLWYHDFHEVSDTEVKHYLDINH
ncbi:hypothetical protein A2872_03155 [Candidatus Gottesmanbacteria bacterium RIFCSPHIGHO2_01_FULL_42_12]|uniref:Phosphoribosyltransferase domain-containing protein n=1 Tax=Candidatus Gottesmanbacteria bacterium RIFCSPHIGHO2_01_FULL_42_12 TaxID=1798377 RepID=A0A1F5Z055_9BACT|nr:MAG: hypothetical protein A2872_03155 [Candidatus Gottesmanbacteria bacterium RIFCSPHIGHO2_01_FULL_42_12]